MQVLLGISLCVLLLTFRTGGVLVAGVDFEDDCWADVSTFFDFDAFDTHQLVGAGIGGAATDQLGAAVSRMGTETCPDDEYVGRHDSLHDNVNPDLEIPPTNQPASIQHPNMPSQAASSRTLAGNGNPQQCQYCQQTYVNVASCIEHERASCIAREPIPGSILTPSEEGYFVLQCRTCEQQCKTKEGFRHHQLRCRGRVERRTNSRVLRAV